MIDVRGLMCPLSPSNPGRIAAVERNERWHRRPYRRRQAGADLSIRQGRSTTQLWPVLLLPRPLYPQLVVMGHQNQWPPPGQKMMRRRGTGRKRRLRQLGAGKQEAVALCQQSERREVRPTASWAPRTTWTRRRSASSWLQNWICLLPDGRGGDLDLDFFFFFFCLCVSLLYFCYST